MEILCVIPTKPGELKPETLKSILDQTVPIKKIFILNQPIRRDYPFAAEISRVLNEGLATVNLEDYDWILRVDADCVLPKPFIEENIRDNGDVVGFGYAMLIRVSAFIKAMGGKFFEHQDDSAVHVLFLKAGYKVGTYRIKPILKRKGGIHHGYKYFIDRGISRWQFGYEPFHVLASLRLSIWNTFTIFAYFQALLTRKKQFDFASFIFHRQIRRLLQVRVLFQSFTEYVPP